MHQKLSQGRFFECNSFCHFIEDLSHHFFRHVVAVLDVFSSDSVVVASFPILSMLIADCISSAMISGISFLSHSLYWPPCSLDLAAEFIEFGGFRDLHTVCCRIHRLRWEFHFSM